MQFTVSTKPFADALDLGVIPANISKYYRLSCLAQLTATKNQLRINLEASNVVTEILLKGSGDEDREVTGFVDCLVLKQLVNTFESNTTRIEYADGGLILYSGNSKFNMPFLAEASEGELRRPNLPANNVTKIPLSLDDWKFVKDYQMYAIALSFVHPVYTNVWIGQDGDVIVGDFDNSLFTFSKKNNLGTTCLLPDTIINLFNSLPSGASITMMDKSYRVDVKTDGYEYATEFTPKYEDENANYSAEPILSSVVKDESNAVKVAVAPITKALSQAELLSSTSEVVDLSVTANEVRIKDENIDCKLSFEGTCNPFEVQLNSKLFKSLVNHIDAENMTISPIVNDGEVAGIIVWTPSLTVMLGAVESGD